MRIRNSNSIVCGIRIVGKTSFTVVMTEIFQIRGEHNIIINGRGLNVLMYSSGVLCGNPRRRVICRRFNIIHL